MPTYEYRCKGCGRELDVVQSFSDDALTTCDACGGNLRKVFGSVGIAFKGSGFYKNDSRGSGSKSATTAGGESTSSNGDGGSTGAAEKSSGADKSADKPTAPATPVKADKAAASTSAT